MALVTTDYLVIERGTTKYKITAADIQTLIGAIRGVSGFCGGKPTASEVVLSANAPYPFTITQANCRASAGTAATASTVFQVTRTRSGSTVNVCTLTFAASGTTATVGTVSNGSILADDIIRIVAPASPDATCADISFLIRQ